MSRSSASQIAITVRGDAGSGAAAQPPTALGLHDADRPDVGLARRTPISSASRARVGLAAVGTAIVLAASACAATPIAGTAVSDAYVPPAVRRWQRQWGGGPPAGAAEDRR